MSNFNVAIQIVLKNEGGCVNNPNDPGGETNFGISKRSYPNVDIANLTADQASAIYLSDFWNPNFYGLINDQNIANKVFDFAVNAGASVANKYLQDSYNNYPCVNDKITVDGSIGPVTLKAINGVDPVILLGIFKSNIATYYRQLVVQNSRNREFLKGWLHRAYE